MSKTKVFPFNKKQESVKIQAATVERDKDGRVTPENLVKWIKETLIVQQAIHGHKEIDAGHYEDLIHALGAYSGIGEIIWSLFAYFNMLLDDYLKQNERLDTLIEIVNTSPEACLEFLRALAQIEKQAAENIGNKEAEMKERLEKAGILPKKETAN